MSTEKDWWDEETERVNRLAEAARKQKKTIKVAPKKMPKLRRDGSIVASKGK